MIECGLCKREVSSTTKHHLVPRTRHRNKKNKKDFSRDDVRSRLVNLCRPCHKFLHVTFTEKKLERDFNTVERLLADPEVEKFVNWIKNKPDGVTVPFDNKRAARRRVKVSDRR